MTVRGSLMGLFLVAAAMVCAQTPAPKESDKAKSAAPAKTQPAPPQSGAMVFIDPVTHQIRQPDESEIGALSAAATAAKAQTAAAPTEPVFIKGPNGAVGMKVGAESLSYMVATKMPDGTIVMECVTADKAAETKAAPGDNKQPAQR